MENESAGRTSAGWGLGLTLRESLRRGGSRSTVGRERRHYPLVNKPVRAYLPAARTRTGTSGYPKGVSRKWERLGLRRLPHESGGPRRGGDHQAGVAVRSTPHSYGYYCQRRSGRQGNDGPAAAVALAERRAPVAQHIAAAVGVGRSRCGGLALVFTHSRLIGTGHASEEGEVKSKKQSQTTASGAKVTNYEG